LRSNLARRAFWLIARQRTRGLEVFTIGDTREVLPVFGFEEEAEMFLRLGLTKEEGWRVRESKRGELASVLHAPCRDIGQVALDPMPGLLGLGTVGFASLSREYFVESLLSEFAPPPVGAVEVIL
jgi:hypothetical protein